MAEIKKHPSLPSNFVTLAQLQERWLKEQKLKQKEIEEERERKERANEEQEIQKQSEIRGKSVISNKSLSIDRPLFHRNLRNRRFGGVGESKSVEATIEGEQQRKESENKEHEIQKPREIRQRSEIINKSVSIDRRPRQTNHRNQSVKSRRYGEVGNSVETEIEEQQQRKERENEEHAINRVDEEENQKRNEIRERSETINNTVSIDRRPILRNHRNRSEKHRRLGEVGVSITAETEIEAVIVVGEAITHQGGKSGKFKKKKKKKGIRGKPRAQENLIEGTTQLPPEKAPEVEIPVAVMERNGEKVVLNGEGTENRLEGKETLVVVTRRNGERESNRRGLRQNEKNLRVNGKIWEKKTPVDPSQPVERQLKFEGLTINGGTIGNKETVMENNGGHGRYNSGYRRYNHPKEYRSVEKELKFEGLTINGGTIGNEETVMENNGGHGKYNSGYRMYNHPKEYQSVQKELKFEGLTINGGTIGNEETVMENNGGHGKYNSGSRRYHHPKEYGSVQTELKLEGLTLDGGTIGNEEPVMENNGGRWKYNSCYGRYNRQIERKPRDCNLAWVKKGEISDADATGIQSSGKILFHCLLYVVPLNVFVL